MIRSVYEDRHRIHIELKVQIRPVGEESGNLFAVWRRPLQVGQELPTLPLPLNVHQSVSIDLEQTYRRAAERAYLT
jgi:hypothetical protein